MVAAWLLPVAFAVDAQALCADVPAVPEPLPPPAAIDTVDPPGPLFPVTWADHDKLKVRGLWYDDQGRVYEFDAVRQHMGDPQPPVRAEPQDFYKGEYQGVKGNHPTGADFYTNTILRCPDYGTCYVAKDKQAWGRASDMADEHNLPIEQWEAQPNHLKWTDHLCDYNQRAAKEQAAKQAARKNTQDAEALQELTTDTPLAAFALANGLYRDLEIDPPQDDDARARDAQAVWDAVQRLGSIDAVKQQAAASSGTLAERLAP